jgi:hypothetical protein
MNRKRSLEPVNFQIAERFRRIAPLQRFVDLLRHAQLELNALSSIGGLSGKKPRPAIEATSGSETDEIAAALRESKSIPLSKLH